jgi:hypothetical protein
MAIELTDQVKAVIESGKLAHFTTIRASGMPHTTLVWVGVDGDEIVIGKLSRFHHSHHPNQNPRHGPMGNGHGLTLRRCDNLA